MATVFLLHQLSTSQLLRLAARLSFILYSACPPNSFAPLCLFRLPSTQKEAGLAAALVEVAPVVPDVAPVVPGVAPMIPGVALVVPVARASEGVVLVAEAAESLLLVRMIEAAVADRPRAAVEAAAVFVVAAFAVWFVAGGLGVGVAIVAVVEGVVAVED